jgi:DNA invertase Pin-like site-specific DNA recombinase
MSGALPLDTATSTGRLILAIIGAVGQAEREAMLERQREGIAKAQRDGKYKGRAPTVQRRATEIIRLKDAGVTPTEIASRLGIGRASVYRVLADQTGGDGAAAYTAGLKAAGCEETTTMIGNEILRDRHGEKKAGEGSRPRWLNLR